MSAFYSLPPGVFPYIIIKMRENIIIGNGVAGITAAQQLRERDANCSIDIFTDELYPFYTRIRLFQIISGQARPEKLFLHTQQWYQQQNINLHLSEPVQEINSQKRLVISDKNAYPYDQLLLANGSHSFIPPIPGADKKGVFTLRTMRDALDIAAYARNIESAVLIGGGLLGLEAAHGLLLAGVPVVKVLEVSPRLLPRQTDTGAASLLQKQLEAKGFEFHLGVKIKQIGGRKKTAGVELEDGRQINGQLVLLSAGVRSNLGLAKKLSLTTNLGVVVNDKLQTSIPNIFAAGDVAEHRGRMYGIWPAAQEQGRVAGINMAGGAETYHGTVISNRLKVAGIELAVAGELDAEGKFRNKLSQTPQVYRKLVLDKDNTVIGCLLLGDSRGYNKLLTAIQEKKVLGKTDM